MLLRECRRLLGSLGGKMAAVVIRVSEEEGDDAASRAGSLPQQPLPLPQQQPSSSQSQPQPQQPKGQEAGIMAQGRDRLDSTASADIMSDSGLGASGRTESNSAEQADGAAGAAGVSSSVKAEADGRQQDASEGGVDYDALLRSELLQGRAGRLCAVGHRQVPSGPRQDAP